MYGYSLKRRILFYSYFLYNKLLLPFNVKKGKWSLFVAELFWTVSVLLRKNINPPFLLDSYYETMWGKFHVNNDLQSIITVSPTFEKMDIEFLIELISKDVAKKSKVLFIDVGAHVGVYSIALGNKFKRKNNFSIIAFEPNANNFFEGNYSLLLRNLKLNDIKNIKVYKKGLGDKKTDKINKFGILTERLDDILGSSFSSKYDSIYIKLDIEGFEESALRGAAKFIENAKKITFIVEDSINVRVVKFLSKNARFVVKLTPYNSFWEKISE